MQNPNIITLQKALIHYSSHPNTDKKESTQARKFLKNLERTYSRQTQCEDFEKLSFWYGDDSLNDGEL